MVSSAHANHPQPYVGNRSLENLQGGKRTPASLAERIGSHRAAPVHLSRKQARNITATGGESHRLRDSRSRPTCAHPHSPGMQPVRSHQRRHPSSNNAFLPRSILQKDLRQHLRMRSRTGLCPISDTHLAAAAHFDRIRAVRIVLA